MTIAFDAHEFDQWQNATEYTYEITVSRSTSAKGAAIIITTHNLASPNPPTAVTWAGESMALVFSEFDSNNGGVQTDVWFLGTGLPADATPEIIYSGHSGNDQRATDIFTFTSGGGDTEWQTGADYGAASEQSPSTATLNLGGEDCYIICTGSFGSGNPDHIAARSGWGTDVNRELDSTDQIVCYTYDTIGSSNIAAGYDNTEARECVVAGNAFNEIAAGGSNTDIPVPLGPVW